MLAAKKIDSTNQPIFLRKTFFSQNEYHRNFYKIDYDAISVVTSEEADEVTPLMSKIYLRLINAPSVYWERTDVLRIEAELREGNQHVKSWSVLCELLNVASATAHKALKWMHERGVIGYHARKNGVGIRIFINRAASAVGTQKIQSAKTFSNGSEKILPFPAASFAARPVSPNETPFNDLSIRSNLELDIYRAPENGAGDNNIFEVSQIESSVSASVPVTTPEQQQELVESSNNIFEQEGSEPTTGASGSQLQLISTNNNPQSSQTNDTAATVPTRSMGIEELKALIASDITSVTIDAAIVRLEQRIGPFVHRAVNKAAESAATQAIARGFELLRQRDEDKLMPKLTRVMVSEIYKIRRQEWSKNKYAQDIYVYPDNPEHKGINQQAAHGRLSSEDLENIVSVQLSYM